MSEVCEDIGYDAWTPRNPTVERNTKTGRFEKLPAKAAPPAKALKAAARQATSEPKPDDGAMFGAAETGQANVQAIAAGQLRSIVERIERLNDDKQAIADDIKDVFAEAKGTGFNVGAVRGLLRLRKMETADRLEAEAILDLYKAALGMA